MSILLSMFIKLSAFSAVAFGGVNALLPDLYALAVTQEQWLSTQTFSDFFAIAQATPGPNLLTVTLIGWHVGGIVGAVIASVAICWPSSIMIYFLQIYITNMRHAQLQKTIQYAASALAVGLVLGSAWGISSQLNQSIGAYVLTIAAMIALYFTRWHPLYLIFGGAVMGALGFI